MHKRSSEWTAETLPAAAAGCFHGNAAADESRDCGIPALYLLPEIKQNNEAEILPPKTCTNSFLLSKTISVLCEHTAFALDRKVQGSKNS